MKPKSLFVLYIFLLVFTCPLYSFAYIKIGDKFLSGGELTTGGQYSNFGVVGEITNDSSINGIYSNNTGFILIATESFPKTWYKDTDNDGYSDGTNKSDETRPEGYYLSSELKSMEIDCNDDNPDINPGAAETCNQQDDNCNGEIDEGIAVKKYYRDSDGDGYGSPVNWVEQCSCPAGYVENNTDCDDTDIRINPDSTELCNLKDDNCNGQIDEEVSNTYYKDYDSDGYGDPNNTILSCSNPSGYVSNNLDCDDNDSNINPSSTETCNSKDDDCNGEVDEGIGSLWYEDSDNDGYGNLEKSQQACSKPSGYVENNTDCDDTNPDKHKDCGAGSGYPLQEIDINGSNSTFPGNKVNLSINYDVTDSNNKLNGLGLRIHYDSSKLTWIKFDNIFEDDKLGEDIQPVNDVEDYDNDTSTDKYLSIAWLSLSGWPNTTLPVKLYDVEFAAADIEEQTTTFIRFSASDNPVGYEFSYIPHSITIVLFNWDIDGNCEAKPLTDGLLVLRYLFGFRGDALIKDAIGEGATRTTAEEIEEYILKGIDIIDIDGNGEAKPLTDGLLLLRYLFGFRGDSLIKDAIGTGSTRTAAPEIEEYIKQYMPTCQLPIIDEPGPSVGGSDDF